MGTDLAVTDRAVRGRRATVRCRGPRQFAARQAAAKAWPHPPAATFFRRGFMLRSIGLMGLAGAILVAGSAPAATPPSVASLQAQLNALQKQVGLLEDKAAIEKLQRAYGYYLDKQLWSEITPLF